MDWKNLKLILFGGKGGVGKTTAASAAAIYLARTDGNSKILVVSTDPAHSLGDSLDYPIGEEITPVKDVDNLWGQELNAPKLGSHFKEKYGDVIKKLVDRGTYFDWQDIEQFFSLSLPGMDEVMAIIEVANLLKSKQFDQIILDTAPTGHTLRFLSLPEHMQKWIEVLDLMQAKHRYLARHFAGRYAKDDADKFLAMMADDMERVKSLLSNVRLTEFVPVTTPELMSIYETERLLDALKDYKIPVENIIVNRIAEERECDFCASRRWDQEGSLGEIEEKFGHHNLIKVPLFPRQIQGINGLTKYGRILFGEVPSELAYPLPEKMPATDEIQINTEGRRAKSRSFLTFFRRGKHESAPLSHRRELSEAEMSGLLEEEPQFLLFGGKGGVGKTSIAAATALRMARRDPAKKTLIFSTDPAHSLSDSFDQEIGNEITPIYYEGQETRDTSPVALYPMQTNLFAIEIDAERLFDNLRDEYRESIEGMFDGFFSGSVDVKFDKEVLTELISLSPPGLDEIMALEEIMGFQNKGEYDFFILDTAPTGHLLRFLEIPDIIREWLNTFFGLLLKYRSMVRLGTLVDKMLELSRGVRRIREVLSDPQMTDFAAITIPEAMAVLEMERLLPQLENLSIHCSHIVINKVIPPTKCGFCDLKRQEQAAYVGEIQLKFPGHTIAELPLFPHAIKGIENLIELSETIYGVHLPVREMERVGSAQLVE